jgi:hypothetical protein
MIYAVYNIKLLKSMFKGYIHLIVNLTNLITKLYSVYLYKYVVLF